MAELNQQLYNKYFKEMPDKSVIFLGQKLIVQIPGYYLEKNITRIEQITVETLGIFKGFIYDNSDIDPEEYTTNFDHEFTLKLPGNIILKPSYIEESIIYNEDIESIMEDGEENATMVKEKIYNLIFLQGDTFILMSDIVKDLDISDKFIDLLLGGKLPPTVSYDEIAILWQKCALINGSGDLNSNFSTFSLIAMNLSRDHKDLSIQFRHVYEKYYKKGIYHGRLLRYMDIPKYISSFTSLTSADPKYGLTVAMARVHGEKQKNIVSPVEEAIK